MYFSFHYLKALAGVSRGMLAAVRDRNQWRHRTVSMNSPEFEDPRQLRAMVQLSTSALKVILNVRQLAMLRAFPERFLIEWQHEDTLHDTKAKNIIGYQSAGPLMGCASFRLTLPMNAKGLYIGVREWHADKRAFCRIDNLFRHDSTVSISLNNVPPVPHPGKTVELHANQAHRFDIIWNQQMFQLYIDNKGVTRARLLQGSTDSVSPLAQVFVWIHASSPTRSQMVNFEPLHSMVQLNAHVTCTLCNKLRTIGRPEWGVCPLCDSWICVAHIASTPVQRCPNCSNQLSDYVGGSDGNMAYTDATAYFQDGLWKHSAITKFEAAVAKVLRNHEDLFADMPLALHLLPHPWQRTPISKRQWEQVMYRARVIIDLLHQQKDIVLFHFLFDQARHLPHHQGNLLEHLPHPVDFENSRRWRAIALDYAVRVHVLLAEHRAERSAARCAIRAESQLILCL